MAPAWHFPPRRAGSTEGAPNTGCGLTVPVALEVPQNCFQHLLALAASPARRRRRRRRRRRSCRRPAAARPRFPAAAGAATAGGSRRRAPPPLPARTGGCSCSRGRRAAEAGGAHARDSRHPDFTSDSRPLDGARRRRRSEIRQPRRRWQATAPAAATRAAAATGCGAAARGCAPRGCAPSRPARRRAAATPRGGPPAPARGDAAASAAPSIRAAAPSRHAAGCWS